MDVGSVSGVAGGSGVGMTPESAPVGNTSETSNDTLNTPVIGEEVEGGKDGRGVCAPGGTDPMETNMSSEDLVSLGQNKGTSSTDDIGWRFNIGGGEESGEGKDLIDQIMKIMEILLALQLLEETMKQLNESGGMGGESGGSAAAGTGAGGMSEGSSGGAAAGGAL
jgi:hypothetical protein|tara:strand:+ start:1474 stop:1971 length:498 start_codon:yes stop_codon:yes gene_type:complete